MPYKLRYYELHDHQINTLLEFKKLYLDHVEKTKEFLKERKEHLEEEKEKFLIDFGRLSIGYVFLLNRKDDHPTERYYLPTEIDEDDTGEFTCGYYVYVRDDNISMSDSKSYVSHLTLVERYSIVGKMSMKEFLHTKIDEII